MIDRVREKYPEHGVWGEENSFNNDKKELWVELQELETIVNNQ